MIKIHRLNNNIDKDIEYQVIINNNFMGNIKNDKIIDFKLRSADDYTIQIKNNKFESDIINFNMNDNQIIEFVCYPKYKNTFVSQFLYKTIFKKEAIKLEKKQDFYL